MDPRIGLPWQDLPTPCLLVDLDRLEANIRRMADQAQKKGVKLRPHVKTHKVPAIAHMQLAAGAAGITVAKVAEAEVMAAHGLRDIFIAYPVVDPAKAARVAALVRQGCRVIAGVDSQEGALALSAAAAAAGVTIAVRIEVNTGLGRSGVEPANAAALATYVQQLPGLELDGIFTFRGYRFPGSAGRTLSDLGREEGEIMATLAEDLRQQGIPIREVSVGSTPTAMFAAVPGVTEVRPGTYVFYDNMQVQLGSCQPEDVALTVLATVVSRPAPDVFTVDAGSKTFCGDVYPPSLGLQGYATAVGLDAFVESMSEEHGVVRLRNGTTPRIGDKVQFVPNHVCTCVNLSDEILGVRSGRVEHVWPVAARGKRE